MAISAFTMHAFHPLIRADLDQLDKSLGLWPANVEWTQPAMNWLKCLASKRYDYVGLTTCAKEVDRQARELASDAWERPHFKKARSSPPFLHQQTGQTWYFGVIRHALLTTLSGHRGTLYATLTSVCIASGQRLVPAIVRQCQGSKKTKLAMASRLAASLVASFSSYILSTLLILFGCRNWRLRSCMCRVYATNPFPGPTSREL